MIQRVLTMTMALGTAMTLLCCAGDSLTASDVTGVWQGPNGSEITVEAGGAFHARALPRHVFLFPDRPGPAFEATGTWKIAKGPGGWEIRVVYLMVDGKAASFEAPVYVEGRGAGMRLFRWMGEEGGARFELARSQP